MPNAHVHCPSCAVRAGTFVCDPASLPVTHWPPTIDNDPLVRQCADMGQHIGLERYGQVYAAAYDDEEHETHFRWAACPVLACVCRTQDVEQGHDFQEGRWRKCSLVSSTKWDTVACVPWHMKTMLAAVPDPAVGQHRY